MAPRAFAGNAQALIDWFNDGADGAISWCSPGDFEDCVSEASKHLDNPEGFCNERHQDACGGPPGSEDHTIPTRGFGIREDGSMAPRSRSQIIGEWRASQGTVLASAQAEALAVSYAWFTDAARERLGVEPYWQADISQDERDKAAASGDAMPDGSYPVRNCAEFDKAVNAVGRGGADHDAIRAHIIKAGAKHDCPAPPDNWNSDGSLKEAAAMPGADHFATLAKLWQEGHLTDDAFLTIGRAALAFPPPPAGAKPAPPAGNKAPPPPPAKSPAPGSQDGKPAPQPGKLPGEEATDASVQAHLEAAQAAIAAAIEAQKGDPGNGGTDPLDDKISAALPQLSKLLDSIMADQKTDSDNAAPAKADAPPDKEPADTADPSAVPSKPAEPSGAPPVPSPAIGAHSTSTNGLGSGTITVATTFAGPGPQPGQTAAPGALPGGHNPLAKPGPADQKPGNADGVPGDADDSPAGPGDIEATVECENPACGHPAAMHEDTADGKNTGACTSGPAGHCPGMVPDADQVNGPADSEGPVAGADGVGDGGGPDNSGGDGVAPVTAAGGGGSGPGGGGHGGGTGAGKAPVGPPDVSDPLPDNAVGQPAQQLPPLNPIPQQPIGPAFTIPVAWLYNAPTGDDRIIDPDALTWRQPPLPLMGLKSSPHDPSGFSPNDPAVLIGKIESISVEGTTGMASGHLLATKDGIEWAEILGQMGRMGVSIDVGSADTEISGGLDLDDLLGGPPPSGPVVLLDDETELPPIMEHLVKGEIMGITVCPFPAFAGAYIILGEGDGSETAPLPPPTPAQASMAIRFVDAAECEPCSGEVASLTASGGAPTPAGGPIAPPAAWFADPGFHVGDERLRETIDAKTGKPSGKLACPMTVTADGRVFGHIAQWGVCHQGPNFLGKGQCVLAPRSRTGYAWFQGRGSIVSAEGEVIDVGRITAGTGHAAQMGISMAEAMAHYDNADMTVALVQAGEDDFGIWVAGSVHPAASAEQVFTLRSNPPSGDWRPVGSGLELAAVLCVNEPGFPVAKARLHDGRIEGLVAAGVPLFEIPAPPVIGTPPTGVEKVLVRIAGRDVRERMAALRGG